VNVKTAAFVGMMLIAPVAFGNKGASPKDTVGSAKLTKILNEKPRKPFGKIRPLSEEPGGSGKVPISTEDVRWECILPEERKTKQKELPNPSK